MIFPSVRCLIATVRSCRTSTRRQTRCTAHRGWLSPPTDTSWWPILATTASKSTATCSSSCRYNSQQPPQCGATSKTALTSPLHSFLDHTVVPSVVCACFKKQLGLNEVWYLQGITHNHVHIPLLGSSNSNLVLYRRLIYDDVVGELENTSLALVSTGTGWTLSKVNEFVT